MLYALIDREDREVTGSPKAPVVEEGLEAAQDPGRAVAEREYPLHEIGAGQVKLGAGDGLAGVLEQARGVLSQDLLQLADGGSGRCGHGTQCRTYRGQLRLATARARPGRKITTRPICLALGLRAAPPGSPPLTRRLASRYAVHLRLQSHS